MSGRVIYEIGGLYIRAEDCLSGRRIVYPSGGLYIRAENYKHEDGELYIRADVGISGQINL